MKKIALVLALLMLAASAMIGCSYESTDIQLISEHALYSTIIHLTEEEVEMLLAFLNEANWQDGVYVLENDYKISLANVTLDYRSGADGAFQAILNDMNKNKHIRLTEEQKAFIDSLIISDMDDLVSGISVGETTYFELCTVIGLEGFWVEYHEGTDYPKTVEWYFGNDGSLRIHLSEPTQLGRAIDPAQMIESYEILP